MGSFKLLDITNNMKQQKYLSQYSEVISIFRHLYIKLS